MKIQNDLQNLSPVSGASQVSHVKGSNDGAALRGAGGESAAAGDQANLSVVAQVASQAMGLSDVRMEKVTAVQAAIAEGSYQVSSSDVAARLVQHMTAGQGNS